MKRLGGVEGLIVAAARGWAARGHEVFVLDRRYGPTDVACEQSDGFQIIRIYCPRVPPVAYLSLSGLWLALSRIDRLWFACRAVAYLRQLEPLDVVNVYDPLTVILAVLLSGPALGRRIVYTHTSSHLLPSSRARDWPLARWMLRQASGRCGWVVLQSEETRRGFVNLGIVDPARTSVIPPGVDVEFWSTQTMPSVDPHPVDLAGREIVVYVGRINREKGVDILIEAMAKLVKEFGRTNSSLILAGPVEEFNWSGNDSSYMRELKARIAEADLEDRISFVGEVRAEKVRHYYACSKIVVLPSRTEAFGMVIAEAMAAGTAVIATDTHGACMQIRNRVNGLLVPVGDAAAMAAAIHSLLADETTRERLAQAGRRGVTRLSWTKISEDYLALFGALRRQDVPHGISPSS